MSIRLVDPVIGMQRTLIRRVFDAAPPDALNLGLGQPDISTPASVCEAAQRAMSEGKTGYTTTAGIPELRQAIAAEYDAHVDGPEGVLVTVGSQEAMYLASRGLLSPGDELLYPDPGYPAYQTLARLAGAKGIAYPLRPENGFRIRVSDIEACLSSRTRAVIVCEPSNPTGACTERAELERLAALLQERSIPWISDEIYSSFNYEQRFTSLAQLAPGAGFVVNSLSKSHSMTGWRLGWLAGPTNAIQPLTALHQHVATCAPSISQWAALEALSSSGQAASREIQQRFHARREAIVQELGRIEGLKVALPDGAFYCFVNVGRWGSGEDVAKRILDRENVIVIPGVAFGEQGQDFVRVSYCAPQSKLVDGCRRIARALE